MDQNLISDQSLLLAIIGALFVAAVLFILLRRSARRSGDNVVDAKPQEPVARAEHAAPTADAVAPPPAQPRPAPAAPHEDDTSVAEAAATAMENVADQFLETESELPGNEGRGDDLTVIKGLGPKAAAQLRELGVTSYAQLAGLDTASAESLDARMGVFKGRLEKDRWIEQARYLARGDRKTFEELFGKIS